MLICTQRDLPPCHGPAHCFPSPVPAAGFCSLQSNLEVESQVESSERTQKLAPCAMALLARTGQHFCFLLPKEEEGWDGTGQDRMNRIAGGKVQGMHFMPPHQSYVEKSAFGTKWNSGTAAGYWSGKARGSKKEAQRWVFKRQGHNRVTSLHKSLAGCLENLGFLLLLGWLHRANTDVIPEANSPFLLQLFCSCPGSRCCNILTLPLWNSVVTSQAVC